MGSCLDGNLAGAVSPARQLAAIWLSDVATSWGRGVHEVVVQSVEQIAYGRLRCRKPTATATSINVKGRWAKAPAVTVVFQNSAEARSR
jgi:hypothetical protein